jgi:hypothetical protein
LPRIMRICTCGEETKPEDISFVMAFKGMFLNFSHDANNGGSNTPIESIWTIHKVPSRDIHQRRGNGKYSSRRWKCVTDGSYLLSCFSLQDKKRSNSSNGHMNMMIFKYEDDAELLITRANDGWLTYQERTFVPGLGSEGLTRSTSVCGGMKCRCRARGVDLIGFAKRHSFGSFVTEQDGSLMGCITNGKKFKAKLSADVLRMPSVGNEEMINMLGFFFSGKDCLQLNFEEIADIHPRHREAALFVWNNLMGGKLLFAGLEARLQPWAMMLPAITTSDVEMDRVLGAAAQLDKMRRIMEHYILQNQNELSILPPSFVRKEKVLQISDSLNDSFRNLSLDNPFDNPPVD